MGVSLNSCNTQVNNGKQREPETSLECLEQETLVGCCVPETSSECLEEDTSVGYFVPETSSECLNLHTSLQAIENVTPSLSIEWDFSTQSNLGRMPEI